MAKFFTKLLPSFCRKPMCILSFGLIAINRDEAYVVFGFLTIDTRNIISQFHIYLLYDDLNNLVCLKSAHVVLQREMMKKLRHHTYQHFYKIAFLRHLAVVSFERAQISIDESIKALFWLILTLLHKNAFFSVFEFLTNFVQNLHQSCAFSYGLPHLGTFPKLIALFHLFFVFSSPTTIDETSLIFDSGF